MMLRLKHRILLLTLGAVFLYSSYSHSQAIGLHRRLFTNIEKRLTGEAFNAVFGSEQIITAVNSLFTNSSAAAAIGMNSQLARNGDNALVIDPALAQSIFIEKYGFDKFSEGKIPESYSEMLENLTDGITFILAELAANVKDERLVQFVYLELLDTILRVPSVTYPKSVKSNGIEHSNDINYFEPTFMAIRLARDLSDNFSDLSESISVTFIDGKTPKSPELSKRVKDKVIFIRRYIEKTLRDLWKVMEDNNHTAIFTTEVIVRSMEYEKRDAVEMLVNLYDLWKKFGLVDDEIASFVTRNALRWLGGNRDFVAAVEQSITTYLYVQVNGQKSR